VETGDGYLGWPEHAPFDAIIVTCAPESVPEPLKEQLAEGGRMVIPVGPQWTSQSLYLLRKRGGELEQRDVLPVRFVPMVHGG
jgi:protein-L-isoaspartate(D-aspartate) O-methyltransferase